MPPRPLPRLRKLCLALPEAHEVEAWGEPTFRVKNKLFAMYADAGNDHGAGRPAVWCKAAPGNQGLMVRAAPDRFFVPPYVGPSGWVGIWLDKGVDWMEVADLLRDSWRLTAPKRLLAALEEPQESREWARMNANTTNTNEAAAALLLLLLYSRSFASIRGCFVLLTSRPERVRRRAAQPVARPANDPIQLRLQQPESAQ